jgi:hypothetical protein
MVCVVALWLGTTLTFRLCFNSLQMQNFHSLLLKFVNRPALVARLLLVSSECNYKESQTHIADLVNMSMYVV